MTANELADSMARLIELTTVSKVRDCDFSAIATMLRQQQAELDAFKLNYYNTGYSLQLRDKDETIKQQQAEIEKLRKIVEDTIGQAFYEDDYHKAQAEIEALKKELALQKLSDIGQAIERELTDKEIESAYWSLVGKQHEGKIASYLYNFARDILQKASEK
jgi:hypothetical protein